LQRNFLTVYAKGRMKPQVEITFR